MSFAGFAPPHEKVHLQKEPFHLEIWPEIGGSIARFDYQNPEGSIVNLFRPATVKDRYFATDLSCWPLVPYSNRIANGAFSFAGKDYHLAHNVEGHPHALHGYGWQRGWQVVETTATSCKLRLDHAPDLDWPFICSAEQHFELTDTGLTITSTLTNHGDVAMPYGLGQHPYIARPQGTRLYADVEGVWLTDDTVLPTEYCPLPKKWSLPQGCLLDDVFMDNGFDGLKGDVRIHWPDCGGLLIKRSDNLNFLVVYNPPQENYVCVEPVSHMTDALNRAAQGQKNTGLTILQPNESAQGLHNFVYLTKQQTEKYS